jgi:osmotically inducible lipoprotein OsmB
LAIAGVSVLLAGCGENPGDRALSGGAIGAGTGAAVGAAGGPVGIGTGAAVGGGAAAGVLTSPNQVNLREREPAWRR